MPKATKFRKLVLACSVLINIALLLYYKYSSFAIATIAGILGKEYEIKSIILPLGISFFTFQQISFAIAIYKEDIKNVNPMDYCCYILYFPKLLMGPLAEPVDFIEQINNKENKRIKWENIACGIKMFSFGLFKKLVLADTFSRGVSWGFSNQSSATAGDILLVMLFYTFEIYFDFSGYSDMAVGVSKMINIDLPMNFDSPYKALTIRDFWKRWHKSLTGFLTKNVYYSLGGNRKGKARTYINIMLVFLISGIWHGANWTFVLWGCLHGIFQIIERLLNKQFNKLHSAVQWIYTFFVVNILWLLFRAESITQWMQMLGKMFSFSNMAISGKLIKTFSLPETQFIIDKLDFLGLNNYVRGLPMLFITAFAFFICLIPENNYNNRNKLSIVNMFLCAIAFVWSFLCLSSESVFVYFNF